MTRVQPPYLSIGATQSAIVGGLVDAPVSLFFDAEACLRETTRGRSEHAPRNIKMYTSNIEY